MLDDLQPLVGLVQPMVGLVQPMVGLVQPMVGLVQPMVGAVDLRRQVRVDGPDLIADLAQDEMGELGIGHSAS
ncbi:MAG: hypothetical protein IPQ07_18675 [Myxococcales bacterium]|nr:hypothetical protein [Myxococcales bacterium]